MTTTTIVLIILSLLAAAGLSFFQYFYKANNKSKLNLSLAFLRFLSVFGLLLLLINPKITRNTYETEKPPLALVVDNSASITELKADKTANELYAKIMANDALKDKFDIQSYSFDSEFETAEAFNFKGTQTNIDAVAQNLKSINKNKVYPTVLITDGNQTTGSDFIYSFDAQNKVFPIVLGDTTQFTDLKISRVNVNKYAFHKNKFPAEFFLEYSGTKSISGNFAIAKGGSVLSRQRVEFSPDKRSAIINVLLNADQVGLQVYRATIASGEAEKNTYNNTKNFALEVIDQKSEIAIVSSINHPDIGALKRAIETNVQRKVTIVKPNDNRALQDYNVLILYQPTVEFKQVFAHSKAAGINTFIISGSATDFNFLNQQQDVVSFRMSSQTEDYLATFNSQFNLFALDDIGFESFPPLQHSFGSVTFKGNVNVLLGSQIRNIETESPLLAFGESERRRTAFLLGENVWKWRLQSHIDTKSFEKFDIFIDKTIQFLASDNARKSLVVTHENFYNSGDAIEITAQFFNKNYEFDDKARLTISVTNRQTKASKRYDLLKTSNAYKVNLDGLPAGRYDFTVKELNSNSRYNGYFEILDFDIEKQFVNPDLQKLRQLASLSNSIVSMPDQTDALIQKLIADTDYKTIQKAIVKKIPLIDSVWLLILIAVCLASEWFIRKYNGLL